MAIEIIMPKIGFSVDEAELTEWSVAEGTAVNEGDVLFTIESNKSTQEVESPAAGTVRNQAQAGVSYQVGTVIGVIE